MTKARDVMTGDATCVQEGQTLADAARLMRELDVGALPICGDDNRLKGMVTDRDIVVRCVADGGDPSQTGVMSLAQGKPVTIGADDDISVALRTMADHQVRRLPVIDGDRLVAFVSIGDLVKHRLELVEHEAEAMRDYIRTA